MGTPALRLYVCVRVAQSVYVWGVGVVNAIGELERGNYDERKNDLFHWRDVSFSSQ